MYVMLTILCDVCGLCHNKHTNNRFLYCDYDVAISSNAIYNTSKIGFIQFCVNLQ